MKVCYCDECGIGDEPIRSFETWRDATSSVFGVLPSNCSQGHKDVRHSLHKSRSEIKKSVGRPHRRIEPYRLGRMRTSPERMRLP